MGSSCCGQSVVRRWGKTQNLSIADQLNAGIRYFDFRVAVHPRTKEFRFVHGLYGGLVSNALTDILNFLTNTYKEVLILDFNHFYNMTKSDHENLLSEIVTRFGYWLVPPPYNESSFRRWEMTLQNLWSTPYRIIPIYHDHTVDHFPQIWSGVNIESPWCNTSNVNTLIRFLDNNYESRNRAHNDTFYNWQGVLTATAKDIILHPGSSLEGLLADKATPTFVNWLNSGKVPGPREINICTVDFVEKYNFIPSVVNLNKQINYFPPSV